MHREGLREPALLALHCKVGQSSDQADPKKKLQGAQQTQPQSQVAKTPMLYKKYSGIAAGPSRCTPVASACSSTICSWPCSHVRLLVYDSAAL